MNKKAVADLLEKEKGIRIDLGCGASKQPGFVGMDMLDLPGVDLVHNIEVTPWPLPDECALTVIASHLLEHINPGMGDSRLQPLIELLINKKVITQAEANQYCGQPGPAFLRVMDEVWRVLKPNCDFLFVVPYGESPGFFQDPTHQNPITETTLRYFDPLDPSGFYYFYKPKPWKIVQRHMDRVGNLEVRLQKRPMDKSYLGIRPPESLTEEKIESVNKIHVR